MRIQHNIAALSSYRNLTNNNSMVSKNLEKLSSGYRINRAGDDAAGLAISEKMRAQITGLQTAQKNANDGISLIQTAEGALTEVHSMLNRMVELANQSANGTYMDDDRESLQAEVNALLDEINRISESTNFNGRTLLNGDMATTTTKADDVATGFKNILAGAISHLADAESKESVKGEFSVDLTELVMRNDGIKMTVDDIGTKTATKTNGDGAGQKATIEYDLTSAKLTLPKDAENGKATVSINGWKVEIDYADGNNDKEMSATEIAAAVRAKLTADGHTTITVGGKDLTLKAGTDEKITFEAADDTAVDTTAWNAFTPSNSAISAGLSDAPVTAHITIGTIELGTGIEIKQGDSMTGAEWAEKFMESIEANDNTVTIDNIDYKVSNNNGKLSFTMVEDPTADFTSNLKVELEIKDANNVLLAKAGSGAQSADATVDKDNDKGAFINQGNGIGVHMDVTPVWGGDRVLAQASIDLEQLDIKDGAALKIGDETYIFALGADSKFKDAANVIDLTKYKTKADTGALQDAANQISKVAVGNKMFDVTTRNAGAGDVGKIFLTERKDSGIDYKKNNLIGSSEKNLYDASNADWAGLIQMGKANPNAKPAVTSGGLVLQIGDTSDAFNQLTVSVEDMSANALGIGDIDISTQDGAAAAVDKIKAAINKVSAQRGDLGALQNRLEHTINNLSVTTENITAAESRIRDVDMAEEMMAYTKNNILVQASQAMLAQANQIPQGVLQLLQ